MPDYLPPLDRLVAFGPVEFNEKWPDYVSILGLTIEHVPELIRMVGDPNLYDSDVENETCATIHARRALGQLRAVEAVGPLLEAMDEYIDGDDFWTEELPEVLATIGPGSLPALAKWLAHSGADEATRNVCAEAIAQIGKKCPESRDECVEILTNQLARHEDHQDAWVVNGFIVSALIDLDATESALAIESAFLADVVDESIAGGWKSTRHQLGLGPTPVGSDIRPRWRLARRLLPNPITQRPNLKKLRAKLKSQKAAKKGKSNRR